MNRLLQVLPAGEAVKVDALQVGPTPMILSGEAPTYSWSPEAWPTSASFDARLQTLYDNNDPELSTLLRRGIAINNLAKQRPDGEAILNQAFYGAGKLLAAPTGPRIASLAVVGWDSHVSQTKGLNTLLAALDNALGDFRRGLGEAAWQHTVVVCVSEFGRTVFDNGRDGTDHGVGSVALLYGGAVRAGVHGELPDLSTLHENRDLRALNDTRALFKGILADHLEVPQSLLDTVVFPESQNVPNIRDLIKGRSDRATSRDVSTVAAPTTPRPTSPRSRRSARAS